MDPLSVYLPADRRRALATGETLANRAHGTALFADISGFTPLTEALSRIYGPRRGAEELARQLNRVYDALIAEVDRYGGSVLGFSGDAITCWFEEKDEEKAEGRRQKAEEDPSSFVLHPSSFRATACALAMQQAMQQFNSVPLPGGGAITLAMKAAVATGPARRFLVGDPDIQLIDVLAGATLARMAAAEHLAQKGEVLLDEPTVALLKPLAPVITWRAGESGQRFAVVERFSKPFTVERFGKSSVKRFSKSFKEQLRPWLLPAVYQRLEGGQGEFLTELRPAVALFLRFGGIDYDGDDQAGSRLDAYVRWVQGVLAQYEGNLVQLTFGDKGSYLYAAFGAPIAHEDDVFRAATVALLLRTPPAELDFIGPVQIGISRGTMRTGAYGGVTRRTYGVLGDDTNLAARLMQAASAGQVLVSDWARQDVAGDFAWRELAPIIVKGKSDPIVVWELVGAGQEKTSYLQEPVYTLPMVGRESELVLVQEKLEDTCQGKGQLIHVVGEAGIGKSRLVAEIIRLANQRQMASYGGECQSYGTNTRYLVWQPIWRAFFNLSAHATTAEQIGQVRQQLEQIDPALLPRLPLLGSVLNLPIPDTELTRSFDAKLRKVSLEALLVDCLRARAHREPLLIVLEDCHWIDPLSRDLLDVVSHAIADLMVLLLVVYRPATRNDLENRFTVGRGTEIRLADFTAGETQRLIQLKLQQLAASPERFGKSLYRERFGKSLYSEGSGESFYSGQAPPALIERIIARAEGNPFYIEELLNYLHDRAVDPYDSRALETLELPASLHSLILSRMDQLSERQKSTLKVASVIGRLFRAALLWATYPELGEPERIKEDLEMLSRLDLTAREASEAELTYLFKHIVTQEVAYESLPYATRARLHGHLAEHLEQNYHGRLEQVLDLLAYHYERSENEAKKREYLRRAGEAAQAVYANQAAINYYQRLLPLLLVDDKVEVMLKQAGVMQLLGRWQEAGDLYQEGLALSEQLQDQLARAWCQTAMSELRRKQGQYAEASLWLMRARMAFGKLNDEAGVAQVLHYAGTVAAQQGRYDTARSLYEESLAIRRALADKPQIANLLNNLGIVARYKADYETARALHEESLALRWQLGDKRAIANSLNNLGNIALDLGDYATARARLEEAVALQREVGDKAYIANALNNLGNVARGQGDYEAARALYRESLAINRELGDGWAIAYLLEDIGGLAALQGEPERALRLVGAAAALREAINSPLSPAEAEKLERALEPARQAISPEAAALALSEGKAMSLEDALTYARVVPVVSNQSMSLS